MFFMKVCLVKAIKIKTIATLSSILLILCGCSQQLITSNIDKIKIDEGFDSSIKSALDFKLVEENNNIQLYINSQSAEVKIINRSTGVAWFSNPQDRVEDKLAVGLSKEELSAQVKIQYNVNDQPLFYNSYTDAVLNNQVSFEKYDNGVKVNYTFGIKPIIYLVPQVLSIKRALQIREKLNEENKVIFDKYYMITSLNDYPNKDDAALMKNAYPILKKNDAYVVQISSSTVDPTKAFASSYLMTILENMFTSAGYSYNDLLDDNKENLVSAKYDPDNTVSLSVVYSIDENSFIATVLTDSIKYNRNNIQVTNVVLLPFFGAANQSRTGYIFVPDGSGALINFNNNKKDFGSFNKKVYGEDYTLPFDEETDTGEQLYLPVFGIKSDNNAFLAVIENGDAVANIMADVSGKTNQYNTVKASFVVNQSTPGTQQNLNMLGTKYQKNLLKSNLQVRYFFLENEDATYSGMALQYQKYLIANKKIIKHDVENVASLNVKFIGAISYKKNILGFPLEIPLSLTSYNQVVEIITQLKSKGIESLAVQYDGWCNNGVKNMAFNNIRILSQLGGEKNFEAMLEYTSMNNISFYPQVNFQYIGKETLFDGFGKRSNASYNLENTITLNKDITISPNYYNKIINDFTKHYKEYGIKSINIGLFGSNLNADYRETRTIDRQEALDIVSNQIYMLSQSGYDVAVNGGNAYAIKGVSLINDIPMKSSNEYFCDETVPFYQMVVHGIISYTSTPLNMSSDYTTDALRLIETGTIPTFEWIFENNKILIDTQNDYYSINYNAWIEKAISIYQTFNDALSDCQNETIVEHRIIRKGLNSTKYSNGNVVFVNYNNNPELINSITINPKSYMVVKGEDK